jgi:hypothetical protein
VYAAHPRPDTGQACDASGRSRAEVERILRTFASWEPRQRDVRVAVEIKDGGDSVILESQVSLTDALGTELLTTVAVRILPQDTRRFIAELIAIADARGL